jgi:uncharacterized coiled-coil DUF342 family protein
MIDRKIEQLYDQCADLNDECYQLRAQIDIKQNKIRELLAEVDELRRMTNATFDTLTNVD